jgi:hypothetical protein
MIMTAIVVAAAFQQAKASSPRDVISKRYIEFNRIMLTRDGQAIKKWFHVNTSPDFTYRTYFGQSLTADQSGVGFARQYAMLKRVTRSDIRMSNYSDRGNQVTCSLIDHLAAITTSGQKLAVDSVSVETWERLKGTWKLVAIVTTQEKTTLDGKSIE